MKQIEVTDAMVLAALDSMRGNIHQNCTCWWCKTRTQVALQAAFANRPEPNT